MTNEEIFQISFDSIVSLEENTDYGTSYSKRIFDTHILKAKYLKDTLQLAKAYRKRVWGESFENAILYVDSALQLTKYLKDLDFNALAHYTKGGILYDVDNPEKALDEFVKSYMFAEKAGNHEKVVDCLNIIAGLKSEYGEQEEAIVLIKNALKYLKNHKAEVNDFDLTYLITLDNIARIYLENRNIDSSRVYTKLGMNLASELNDEETYEKLAILYAQADYYNGSFLKSRDTILKYIKTYQGYSRADMLFYLGKIEGRLGNPQIQKKYFKKIDSILLKLEYPPFDNANTVFQFLLKDAINKNETTEEKVYLNKMIYYDSLINETERNIRKVSLNSFDIPLQEASEKGFLSKINKDKKKIKVIYTVVIVLLLICVIILYGYFKTKKKLSKLMQQTIRPKNTLEKSTSKIDIGIDEDIIKDILLNLENWEREKKFLDSSIDQSILAKKLNTNSSYLSKIINLYKGQSFSNYLKDIRISYALNYIKANPKFILNKSTIQIAEYFGFNSIDVFVKTMKAKVGITPSTFFKQIKKSNL